MKVEELFELSKGKRISKGTLFDLIQYSKQPGSEHWSGTYGRIGNTPQQGINWIGLPPHVRGVIIKTSLGLYAHDGWSDDDHVSYRYSFKARKSVINHGELANRVLIDQPLGLYPLLLFTDVGSEWQFEGRFDVSEVADSHVVLRHQSPVSDQSPESTSIVWREGHKRYVTHLLTERSGSLVAWLKRVMSPACDVCCDNPGERYGVAVIEAHHTTPLSTSLGDHEVTPDDIALVCPNCHRAVHACMRQGMASYDAIREHLRERLSLSGWSSTVQDGRPPTESQKRRSSSLKSDE
ncbi:HNH endonuclease [Bosea sp. PAMC 26642]|uniref:HNH endonuclease n=1 Tax=Bosea sp. (strain PAMC 26642) TaxID=1792307 RepID=UPI0009E936DF|nr:HNH endonuclease [Bosea sp. PAMC 26642]